LEEKLSDKIFKEIRSDIIQGKYKSRDFISESMIAKKYGVSKAPVKEAMHNLVSQGYLIIYPRKGYMVNILSKDETNQIQTIRRELGALSVRLAIQNATDEEILSLRFYKDPVEKNMDPRETVNTKFHMRLAEISGNQFLPETVGPLVNKASMSHINEEPDTDHFDKIVDAMLERDEEKAVEYLLEDIRYI
jgi:DNA-binding GntR family transcriptional regulator